MAIMATMAGFVIVKTQDQNEQLQAQNEALCEVSQVNRDVIFNILTLSEQRALENATSPQQIDEIEQAYDEFFALVPPIECGKGGPVELEP